ncbi:MAG: bifunctional oligoribonuclease/PAP phosphatase NrnA [Elusimicrobiales bacterium]|nr:bifunctional oligoribonuclease/PAP phosphatase NrnA [Elusimicrobiales bacterium]
MILSKIKEIPKLSNLLKNSNTFFLTLHTIPDADSCGSMLCFYEFLKRLGKKVYLYSSDRLSENLLVLPYVDKIKNNLTEYNYDVIVFFECSTPQRSGIDITKFKYKAIVNIDHHKTAKRYGNINIIYPHYPSTSEIIWYILKEMNFNITKTMAINLYCGIITDTGRFQYSQTLPETLKVAGELIKHKFNFQKLNENFFATTTYRNLKLLGVALSSLEFSNGIAIMNIKEEDFKKFSADFSDTENIINYPMMIPETKVTILIKEDLEKYSVTFRSKDDIDVGLVALEFGGGGHKNASGFKISKNRVKNIEELIKKVKKCLIKKIKNNG